MEHVEKTGGDKRHHHGIIKRYFEIVNLYPDIKDPALRKRIEEFTMNAGTDELFQMQTTVFKAGREFINGSPGWETILDHLEGKKVGVCIGNEYFTTVELKDRQFILEQGVPETTIPVFSVASRKDYVDTLLRRREPFRMIITGKLKATHKFTLAKWGYEFFHLLSDDVLFDELLENWVDAEQIIAGTLDTLGF